VKQQKEDRQSRRTYRLVSDAFIELLLEKPYDAILVQDILDRAGIGRTTFYAHYFDKKDALESTVEQMMETFSQLVAHREAGQEILLGADMFYHVHQHRQVFQALFRHGGVVLWETGQAMLSKAIPFPLCLTIWAGLFSICSKDGWRTKRQTLQSRWTRSSNNW
jgi:AcrR family transcriptional regulator